MGTRFLISSGIYHCSKYLVKNSKYISKLLRVFATSDCEREKIFSNRFLKASKVMLDKLLSVDASCLACFFIF